MKILIAYGTTEGQTRRIAERMAERARAAGHEVDLADASSLEAGYSPRAHDAVIVGASVHQGKHQAFVAQFVRDHLADLRRKPSAFFSVSLAAAAPMAHEGDDAPRRMTEEFLESTGFAPDATAEIAGALRYTEYDYFKRIMMKLIAKRSGGDTDTARDHEYTDWEAVARFVDGFLDLAAARIGRAA